MSGAAIRAAAKAAAFRCPSIFGGYATARRPALPPSATGSAVAAAAPDAAVFVDNSDKPRSEAAAQRAAIDTEEWEFAGWAAAEEKVVHEEPRLVFGPVPSFEEAKAATADLTDAIERTNISHAAAVDSAIIPEMPKKALQAFSFLQKSPEVQNVVASLACDENVWNAVLKNEKVIEFYNNSQSVITQLSLEDGIEYYDRNAAEDNSSRASKASEENSSDETVHSGFQGFVQTVKIKVEEVVKNISTFFQDTLAGSHVSSGNKAENDTAGSYTEAAPGPGVFGLGSTFIGLAIATILVVLFKRA